MRTDRTSEERPGPRFRADVVLSKILAHHNDRSVDHVYDCATGDYIGRRRTKDHNKSYVVTLQGPIRPTDIDGLRAGIDRAHDALGLPLFVPGP